LTIYATADLHLSGNPPTKPMDIFSPSWQDHWSKISSDWKSRVNADDWVILAGDISWGMKWSETEPDLQAIAALPGRKVIIRGNHDYWWSTVSKMSRLADPSLLFLQNSFIAAGEIAICGSRGWITPSDPGFSVEDEPIYLREAQRLRLSLSAARSAGYRRLLLAMHFPPARHLTEDNLFTELLGEYAVETCVFGHLHAESADTAPVGNINGAACHLVACDALDFGLMKVY
jgi:predicted phosphohydrolase